MFCILRPFDANSLKLNVFLCSSEFFQMFLLSYRWELHILTIVCIKTVSLAYIDTLQLDIGNWWKTRHTKCLSSGLNWWNKCFLVSKTFWIQVCSFFFCIIERYLPFKNCWQLTLRSTLIIFNTIGIVYRHS